ncbi:MAG: pyridoxal 5'-phosphate synthase lyase subunit PdxS [Thermoplasmatales archaeon]
MATEINVKYGTDLLKKGFAKMTKGGVIMDVTNATQAKIAEEAGAISVMALERVPADIRAEGGVARMADPLKIKEIVDSVTIPVMAKVRIGHLAEAKALETLGIDMIDESEVLTPADPFFHVDKRKISIPFVCGARNLGEAVRRIWEGAAMIRTKGEAGTGDIIEAVRHVRLVNQGIVEVVNADEGELWEMTVSISKSYENLIKEVRGSLFGKENVLDSDMIFPDITYGEIKKGILGVLKEIKKAKRLPVVNFAAGGIATPADAVLMMQHGVDGVFVGSGIFKSPNPDKMASSIVQATAAWDDPSILVEMSKGLSGMKGRDVEKMAEGEKIQGRGW